MEQAHQERIEHNGVLLDAHMVLPAPQLQAGVRAVAEAIARWHAHNPEPLEMICILNGARRFCADLANRLAERGTHVNVHFIRVSSTEGARTTGSARLVEGELLPERLRGRKLLVVDDIVDTGATMGFVKELALAAGAREVKCAAVVNKYADHSAVADFTALDLKLTHDQLKNDEGKKIDYWLFGYGMDLSGHFRDLDHIAWVVVEG